MTTFHTLLTNNKLPKVEIFCYLQLQYFVASMISAPIKVVTLGPFENCCHHDPHFPGLISLLYSLLLTDSSPPQHAYMHRWESDLNITLWSEQKQIWDTTILCSQSNLVLETKYKILCIVGIWSQLELHVIPQGR